MQGLRRNQADHSSDNFLTLGSKTEVVRRRGLEHARKLKMPRRIDNPLIH